LPEQRKPETAGLVAADASLTRDSQNVGLRVMPVALGVAVSLLALKFYGYWITGSSAILSDALESIINVVAAAFSFGSLWLVSKPPDDSHPYGHGKIEFFAAGFEGAMILIAALGIFVEGVTQILNPRELPHLAQGVAILVLAAAVNLALGTVLVRSGRRTKSLVLQAHGRHVLTDVYSSAGVLIGLAVVSWTGWYVLDGVVACLVGAQIIIQAHPLVRQAFGGLMDASDPALLAEICTVLQEHRKEVWIDVHRLRAWRSGQRVHVDFHLILPRDLPLEQGHLEVKELERVFGGHFNGQAEILVHLDPCATPECPVCSNDPCDLRQEKKKEANSWHLQHVVRDDPTSD
jgi:cation diffusion facilitator family transporter